MLHRLLFLVVLVTTPVAAIPLSPIHPHPRLIATSKALQGLARLRPGHLDLEQKISTVESRGHSYLAEPFPSHTILGGRMLDESRRALAHLTTFAFLYRLDHNPQWRQRASEEMRAISAFPDWHPQHFLDTAENDRGDTAIRLVSSNDFLKIENEARQDLFAGQAIRFE